MPSLRPEAIRRPHLVARLDEGRQRQVTLISAPAGFGKTTLVSEWIAHCDMPIAWLSLDSEDNDPTRFLTYLVSSLKTIPINIDDGLLSMLDPPQPSSNQYMLTVLLNEISSFPDHFFLVLDDYHVIDAKAVNDALAFLLEHLPRQMHLVIATREDQPRPLARLRARGQLSELRAADLRFSFSEAVDFLRQVMGLQLSDKDVSDLENRTEGWIAGLQLAAVSMQGHKDVAGFIRSFTGSHHFILDYLIEEVLQRQSEQVKSFLLRTSILDRMCGPLCDAVLHDPSGSGQDTLEYLERANLFIVPLDTERRWFRYHHLFAELLRQRFGQGPPAAGGEKTAQYHIRASEWFEKNELVGEAVSHAVIAKDFERAAALIELAWADMDKGMQSAVWLGWVKSIPEGIVRSRPVLSVGYAWALLDTGRFEGCEQRLQDAEKAMDRLRGEGSGNEESKCGIVVSDEEQFRFLPATIESARAYHASAMGDKKTAIEHARKALDLVEKEDHIRRSMLETLLGLALWANGELEAAYSAIVAGVSDDYMEIMVAIVLAELRIEQGRLRQACQIYEKSLQAAEAGEENFSIPLASFYLGLGKIKFLKGDLREAEMLLQRSREQGDRATLYNWRYNWHLLQAGIKGSLGNFDEAMDSLNEAEKYYIRSPIPDTKPLHALKTRMMIRQGKRINATDWMKEHGLKMEDGLEYIREFEHVTLARVFISEYGHSKKDELLFEAGQLTERLLLEAQIGNRPGSVIEIRLLQAMVHKAKDEMELAEKCLEEALILAEPEGYVQIFADEGLQMRQLLTASVINEIMPGDMSKVHSAMEGKRGVIEAGGALSTPAVDLMEPLSEREFEILQLIAKGLTNHEICERLFLALSTVKGYNQNLYGKLQVKSRTEAIARAREWKLI